MSCILSHLLITFVHFFVNLRFLLKNACFWSVKDLHHCHTWELVQVFTESHKERKNFDFNVLLSEYHVHCLQEYRKICETKRFSLWIWIWTKIWSRNMNLPFLETQESYKDESCTIIQGQVFLEACNWKLVLKYTHLLILLLFASMSHWRFLSFLSIPILSIAATYLQQNFTFKCYNNGRGNGCVVCVCVCECLCVHVYMSKCVLVERSGAFSKTKIFVVFTMGSKFHFTWWKTYFFQLVDIFLKLEEMEYQILLH